MFGVRSLRSRIILLALFASILLIAAGVSFFSFLNSSQKAKMDSAQRHLIVLASAMRSDYAAQLAHGTSLEAVHREMHPPPPPPPRPGTSPRFANRSLSAPPGPPVPPEDLVVRPLVAITTAVLRRESDVEGGFYAASSDALTGYAFPTHLGPGGPGEIPGKERPEIEELARQAASTGTLQKQSFHGAHDAILFVAVPVRDGQRITGAAWLMQRMPGLEAGRSKQLLLGSLGFTAAALVCAMLTFFITSEVNSGVQTVLTRLGNMEGSLDEYPRGAKPQLNEFEQVLTRVDALSASLKQKIQTQRALEDEVRHRQRLSALGQFAAGVAHELRNPLATIRLRAQMSQRTLDSKAIERNSAVVLSEVDRLDRMIERLLYFSRPIRLQLESTSLNALCSQTCEAWHVRCSAEQIRLVCEIPDDLYATCDVSKIRQVLDNLLENALHSVLSAPDAIRQIVLVGRQEAEQVILEVADGGTGLDADTEAHALEPFYTTKDTGTGLGLSISYEIMQAHGGDLHLRNNGSGGAVAEMRMPVAAVANASNGATL